MFVVQENSTALECASTNGHDEVVRILLAAKATVNTQNKVSTEWSTCKQALSDVSFYNICAVRGDPSLVR